MIFLFHGEEDFERSERIAALKAGISDDPSFIDMNVNEMEGRSTTKGDLIHHCDVPPFLGNYRLVIVKGLLAGIGGGKGEQAGDEPASGSGSELLAWLASYLPTIPDTTCLVLVENKKLPAGNKILKAIASLGNRGEVEAFEAPSPKKGDLDRWVEARARKKGARLDSGVAHDLASFIGPDLRLIDSELEKLAAYADKRPITRADVRLLTPYAQDANIFDMVDALGHRRTAEAFRLLAQLRNEGAHPLYLLTMIVRQYRILLQVKALQDQGLDRDAIAGKLGLHPFPAGKAMEQARAYAPGQLTAIYDRLLATDVAIKTGQMDANVALDLLVVELARA